VSNLERHVLCVQSAKLLGEIDGINLNLAEPFRLKKNNATEKGRGEEGGISSTSAAPRSRHQEGTGEESCNIKRIYQQ